MHQSHGTTLPNSGERPRRKSRLTWHESDIGLALMLAGLVYGIYLNFQFDPSHGSLPVLLLVLGFALVLPEIRRISGGRRVARS